MSFVRCGRRAGIFLAVLIAARGANTAAAAANQLMRVETSVPAMGGTFSIVAYGPDAEVLRSATEAAAEEARRLDQAMSNYVPSSEWSEVNRDASHQPVKVSEEMFDLIAACVDYSKASEGAFDITVGPLMKVWGFYKGTGHLPHRAEVRTALAHVGSQYIELDKRTHSVRFLRSDMNIDPGGIGKGYAVDRMIGIIRQYGVKSALISAARSSIYALGTPPNEPGWRAQIRDPRDGSKVATEVLLHDESMSTSGNYEKFFVAEGKLYSHIMDPRTGFPSQGMIQVSVITPRTIDSEAWTKPVYIQGREWAENHLPKGFRAYVCEDGQPDRGPITASRGEREPCVWLR